MTPSLGDFRATLRKGNQRPSPGPDGWGKWCVKNLSDRSLKLALDLHKFIGQNTVSPGNVKDMTLTIIHELPYDMANPLIDRLYRKKVDYHKYTTTQQGVQTRDVISYLASIKCYAQRNKQTVYALQRDQMKGFDYVALQGFYDALEAYGFPDAIAELDRAAQSHTKVLICTAYSMAGPITVNAVTKPQTIQIPSIMIKDCTYVLKPGELCFLRASIVDTASRFQELKDFIEIFKFPKFTICAPITLARKVVMQNVASKCRALLSIQPIKPSEAQILDHLICQGIHKMLSFPYSPNSTILTLPLEDYGIDFPSIERINVGIAGKGLMRDLNHHIPAYRAASRITLADWTCHYNNCMNAIDGKCKKDFCHYYGRLPSSWIIAHRIMGMMSPPINLRLTDAKYIIRGDVSIQHVANIAKEKGLDNLHGRAISALAKKGLRTLNDVGSWRLDDDAGGYTF
ncbi:LOW QUALITY PROTEIN: hypothetical protein CVT26_002942 [Gymnopilus dilepis]|uniref:Reverse transcriptase domain-containing protein n=1 Tax=Gymnopilus dilepis TaxID=231916 RepID=A0A409Y4I3_9AGAR|nr:LOW QUALITY PROTEIN: hypothetical protein CVT26_002942 [Gymnopilus dilepis]